MSKRKVATRISVSEPPLYLTEMTLKTVNKLYEVQLFDYYE